MASHITSSAEIGCAVDVSVIAADSTNGGAGVVLRRHLVSLLSQCLKSDKTRFTCTFCGRRMVPDMGSYLSRGSEILSPLSTGSCRWAHGRVHQVSLSYFEM